MNIGIDQISFYVPQYYLDLAVLAEHHGIDVNKYHRGIGQEKMSMPPHDEDVVTLGANAAYPIIERNGVDDIDTILFATETGIDQSKAAAVYVHQLLGLHTNCRAVELKQACYSATAALQMACGYIALNPNKKVLLIASDISRYELDSAAEPTQGCGAVAILLSQHPRLLTINPISGKYTEDVMDFWRPNYRKTALVDGKFSTQMYIKALDAAWKDYQAQDGLPFASFVQFCYHLPFSKMGVKAHRHLAAINDTKATAEQTADAMHYNRIIGNSYSASLYIGLASLLDHRDDLEGKHIALFSYGSGCVGEFFTATVQDGYIQHRFKAYHARLLKEREAISYETYLDFWQYPDPKEGEHVDMHHYNRGTFRLVDISNHQRHYQKT